MANPPVPPSRSTSPRVGQPLFSFQDLLNGELLSELVHKFGHEIDNPLTAVISLSTILNRADLERESGAEFAEKLRKYSGNIISEAWRVSSNLNRLVLLLSDRVHPDAATDFNRALSSLLAKLGDREDFDTSRFRLQLPQGEPFVSLDSLQLTTVLNELLTNAHDFCIPGSKLELCAVTVEDSLRLTISGPTRAPRTSDLSELFNPFVSEQSEVRRLGLGLTIVWAILERVRGTVSVEESVTGNESTFSTRITIPLATPHGS